MFLKSKAAVDGVQMGIGWRSPARSRWRARDVVLNGFGQPDEIEALRRGIETEFGVRAAYSPADMTKPDEIAAMILQGEEEFGSVDILVNNAGVQHVFRRGLPDRQVDAIIAINLSSAFHAIRAVVPARSSAAGDAIINTASAHSLVASPKSAYVAAKHGIAGLTKTVGSSSRPTRSPRTASALDIWTPPVERQIPDTMKARSLTKEQVINDVLLEA